MLTKKQMGRLSTLQATFLQPNDGTHKDLVFIIEREAAIQKAEQAR